MGLTSQLDRRRWKELHFLAGAEQPRPALLRSYLLGQILGGGAGLTCRTPGRTAACDGIITAPHLNVVAAGCFISCQSSQLSSNEDVRGVVEGLSSGDGQIPTTNTLKVNTCPCPRWQRSGKFERAQRPSPSVLFLICATPLVVTSLVPVEDRKHIQSTMSKAAFTLALHRRVGLDVRKDEKHKRERVQLIRPPTCTHPHADLLIHLGAKMLMG